VRYDPFDLREIQVWQDEKRCADAVPVELRRKRRGPEEKRATTDAPKTETETLSFLALAENKRQAAWTAEEVRYARVKDGERG
jgi:hypothetical protein